jgi:hypothetical protein
MQVGDYVKFNNNEGDLEETLWEVVGFEERGGCVFVLIKHPTIGGRYSFPKNDVVEVING